MSLHKPLYTTFLLSQLYALTYHFPHPPTGLVHPAYLTVLKLLSILAATTSLTPILASPSGHTATLLFITSIMLFLWTAHTTRPHNLSVIFSRVTPRYVLDSGPFAHVRHPTYVSYALGWMGALAQVLLSPDVEGSWVEGGVRKGMMVGCVVGLCWMYWVGAVLEEVQFLEDQNTVVGEKVDKRVRMEYLAYMRMVRGRWVPGVV